MKGYLIGCPVLAGLLVMELMVFALIGRYVGWRALTAQLIVPVIDYS